MHPLPEAEPDSPQDPAASPRKAKNTREERAHRLPPFPRSGDPARDLAHIEDADALFRWALEILPARNKLDEARRAEFDAAFLARADAIGADPELLIAFQAKRACPRIRQMAPPCPPLEGLAMQRKLPFRRCERRSLPSLLRAKIMLRQDGTLLRLRHPDEIGLLRLRSSSAARLARRSRERQRSRSAGRDLSDLRPTKDAARYQRDRADQATGARSSRTSSTACATRCLDGRCRRRANGKN